MAFRYKSVSDSNIKKTIFAFPGPFQCRFGGGAGERLQFTGIETQQMHESEIKTIDGRVVRSPDSDNPG